MLWMSIMSILYTKQVTKPDNNKIGRDQQKCNGCVIVYLFLVCLMSEFLYFCSSFFFLESEHIGLNSIHAFQKPSWVERLLSIAITWSNHTGHLSIYSFIYTMLTMHVKWRWCSRSMLKKFDVPNVLEFFS